MSDYEDEMDVDAPVADNAIAFGGDPKKGKRSAANLPVEAEDSLPWYVDRKPAVHVDVNLSKGGKVSTKFARRCRRPQRHNSHHQQVR